MSIKENINIKDKIFTGEIQNDYTSTCKIYLAKFLWPTDQFVNVAVNLNLSQPSL